MEESHSRLRQLQTISEAALAHLNFEDLVNVLLERLRELLGTDTAAVLLIDEDGDELVARAAKGLEEEVEARVRVPVGTGFAGRIAAERGPVAIHLDEFEVVNPILHQKGLKSMLGAPLLVEGRVIGVTHVGTLYRRDFSEDEAELLQLAADRMAIAIDHARLYEAERAAAEQVRRLEALTEAGLAHLSLTDLLGVLLERVRELLASDTVVLLLSEPETGDLTVQAVLGAGPERLAQTRVPHGVGFTGRVAAEGRAAVLDDMPEATELEWLTDGTRLASMAAAPLVAAGRTSGVLAVGSVEARRFSGTDAGLLQRAADRIALAVENSRLYEAERAARAEAEQNAEQIRRIESISSAALHHITPDSSVFETLLRRVREALEADTAGLLVADEGTQVLIMRAAEGLREEVERDVAVPIGRGFAGMIAERRAAVIVDDASEIEIVSPMLRSSGVVSLAGLPLLIEGRMLGVLLVGSRRPAAFAEDSLALLNLAGERLAVALDHARLYEREHFIATTLQRSLLPERLPEVPGTSLASRYLPGEQEAVGGDWYDVMPLSDGRIALAMGDVVSRGVRAASSMGQLRNAMRAYAIEDHDPASVLTRLDRVARHMDGREMATLAYLVLDLEARELIYANAGHPPPLLITPQREVTLLEEGRGPPLGALPDSSYTVGRTSVDPEDTLLLYTDGIVERRDLWIDEGIDRLVDVLRAVAGDHPDDVVEHLVATILGGGRAEDDVALLALRLDKLPENVLRLRLPADPDVLMSMRQSLRRWLTEAEADADTTYDILVSVTEAAANSIEHAYGPGDATFEVDARFEEGMVSVVVRDRGAWRPPRGQNRGRGTMLMQELMDEMEVDTGEGGTEVRMTKRLVPAGFA